MITYQWSVPKEKAIVPRPSFVEGSWWSGYVRLEISIGC